MKTIILLTLFLVSFIFNVFSTNYYVSTTGNNSNNGSIENPLATLWKAMEVVQPGDSILIRGGLYSVETTALSADGTEENPIVISGYKNEKVIFKGSGQSENAEKFNTYTSWCIFKNFEVSYCNTGIKLVTSHTAHNTYINIDSHHHYIASFFLYGGACYNTFINCDAHENYDSATDGGNADGFRCTGWNDGKKDNGVGPGNVFKYCRSWGNSDDGFDAWLAENSVTYIGCMAYNNGTHSGDGNGFKLGKAATSDQSAMNDSHVLKNCLAWENIQNGFDYNNNIHSQTLYNCTAWNNNKNYRFGNVDGGPDIDNIQNCISVISVVDDYLLQSIKDTYTNSWNIISSPNLANVMEDNFLSTDDAVITGERNDDGSIPESDFLKLKSTSVFVDAGVNVGLPYNGSSPDLGAFEYKSSQAITADFTADVISCSASVLFTNTSSGATSYSWDFGDGNSSTEKSPSHTYSQSGTYKVKLTISDGSDTDTKEENVTVNFSPKPTGATGTSNGSGTVNLKATSTGTINWYDVATGGTPVATGSDVTINSSATTFYAENVIGGGLTVTGGKSNKGTGAYYEWEDSDAVWGLKFDVLEDITLKSVKVYNGASSKGSYIGNRIIKLVNSSGDTILRKIVNVVDGEQILQLDMQISKGSGYRLLADTHVGFWRDNSGANYPYNVGSAVTITADTKHDGTIGTTADAYHFFYDWKVETGATGCTSERVKVDVITDVQNTQTQEITVYPNPARDEITISGLPQGGSTIEIYNSNMQLVRIKACSTGSSLSINISNMEQGVYFYKIRNNNNVIIRKVLVIK